MLIAIIRSLRTIFFCITKITILRNTLCSWVTNTDITRSQEILLRMLCKFTKACFPLAIFFARIDFFRRCACAFCTNRVRRGEQKPSKTLTAAKKRVRTSSTFSRRKKAQPIRFQKKAFNSP